MKSLKPRLLTAVIGIPLLILIMFVSEQWMPSMGIIVGIATGFMVGEYLNAKKLLKQFFVSVPCILFAALMPLLIFTQYLYLLLFIYMIVGFLSIIKNHNVLSYLELAYAFTGTLLISFGMSAIPVACNNEFSVVFFFVLAFLLPWMADAGGFFVGATLGKHKLCPNISPKKTVEGALGGIIFCIISALCMGLVFQFIIMPDVKISFAALTVLALADSALSILGDLSFSLIKRSLSIKDYGWIFPGHGGMLDRFDSIIFTAPAIVLINQFIPFVTLG